MGKARSYMARLAAQSHRLAGKNRTDSMGIRRDRAQDCDRRDRAHPSKFAGTAIARPQNPEKSRSEREPRAVFSVRDESRVDTRFWADFCAARKAAARGRHRAISVQCLGAVSRLAER